MSGSFQGTDNIGILKRSRTVFLLWSNWEASSYSCSSQQAASTTGLAIKVADPVTGEVIPSNFELDKYLMVSGG